MMYNLMYDDDVAQAHMKLGSKNIFFLCEKGQAQAGTGKLIAKGKRLSKREKKNVKGEVARVGAKKNCLR